MAVKEINNKRISGGRPSGFQEIATEKEIAQDGEILYTQEGMFVSIEEFEVPNSRIDGLRKLAKVGAPIASPAFVIPHESFLAYKENPEQTMAQLEKELKAPARQAMANSKKNSIALRRAYEVPGLANPPGPHYLGTNDKSITKHVRELFDFAIEEGYDDVEGAQIVCFFYPFIDPEYKPLEKVERNDVLPYGGHIIVDPDNLNNFQVLATPGNHETLMWYERRGKPVETYHLVVDPTNPERIMISKKDVVQKDEMHYTNEQGKNAIVGVPQTHQLQQVMYDSEIIEVAHHAVKLVQEYGPQRAEFTFDGEKLFFNECIDMKREIQVAPDYSTQGEIFVVKSREDVERLASLTNQERQNLIVYAADVEAGHDTYIDLAERFKDKHLTVLYAGTSRTAHLMRVFQDKGHFPFAIGRQDLREGDMVSISSKNGFVDLENLTISRLPEITPLSLAYKMTREQVGGKAERLSYLQLKGFNVPDGAVLSAKFFDQVLESNRADKLLEKLILEHAPIDELSQLMQNKIREIPDSLWKKVLSLLRRYDLFSRNRKIIARSSANVEDLRGESYAGVFESYPFLIGEESIREGILNCIRSTFSSKVLANIGKENLEELLRIKMAVLVQEMIDARISGTLFGKDTQSGSERIVTIEAKRGLGQEIVEGRGVEQCLVFDKTDRKCRFDKGKQILDNTEIQFLLDLSSLLEKRFRFPQDVEWSVDKEGNFWILQSRDL